MGLLCLLPIFAMMFLISGVVFGMRCAMNTSFRIASEREKGTYDLLAVTPTGAFGVSWSLCTGYLRHYENFDLIRRILFYMGMSVALGSGLITLWAALNAILRPDSVSWVDWQYGIATITGLTAVALAFYINFTQSVILGSLLGMLVPAYTPNKVDAQFYALLAYLMTIVATAAVAGVVIVTVTPFLESLDSWVINAFVPLVNVGIFYLMREFTVQLLWHKIIEQLNVAASDIDVVLKPIPL